MSKIKNSIFFLIFLSFFCTSCAIFAPFSPLDSTKRLKKTDFEGIYEGKFFTDVSGSKKYEKDTLYFQLKFLNKKELLITQFLNNKVLYEKIKSYRFKRNKYLRLKGDNSITGIPFLCGSFRATRFRLSKDEYSPLLCLESSYSAGGGAFIVVFLNIQNDKEVHYYKNKL